MAEPVRQTGQAFSDQVDPRSPLSWPSHGSVCSTLSICVRLRVWYSAPCLTAAVSWFLCEHADISCLFNPFSTLKFFNFAEKSFDWMRPICATRAAVNVSAAAKRNSMCRGKVHFFTSLHAFNLAVVRAYCAPIHHWGARQTRRGQRKRRGADETSRTPRTAPSCGQIKHEPRQFFLDFFFSTLLFYRFSFAHITLRPALGAAGTYIRVYAISWCAGFLRFLFASLRDETPCSDCDRIMPVLRASR